MSKKDKKIDKIKELYQEQAFSQVIIEGQELLEKEKNRSAKRVLYNYIGLALLEMDDHDQAIENLRKARSHLSIKDFYSPLIEYYEKRKQWSNLVKCFEDILKYYPDDTITLESLAKLYMMMGNDTKAMYYLTNTQNWGMLAHFCRSLVFWDNLDKIDELFVTYLRDNMLENDNIALLWYSIMIPKISQLDSYNLIRKTVLTGLEHFNLINIQPMIEGFERKEPRVSAAKLRIGYLSSDFYDHATMLLLARVLELHNRNNFDIHLFIVNKKMNDSYGKRIENMAAHKHYLYQKENNEIAELINEQNIDILIDLKGFTKNTASYVSAYRPAPIIVNWLGFPTTMGLERMADYIITDKIVTPAEQAQFFSETLAYMPNCYQPNDNSIEYSSSITRKDVGLPHEAIVFCSFNSILKLNPQQFDFWCRLLQNVENSVLWILRPSNKMAIKNLLKEAEKRDIDTLRIIFAEKVPIIEHRKRLHLADIGLDSFPCTSHTTASDLMAAGVPLVAQIGNTFWSRVSASVLTANNCSQLVAYNIEQAYNIAYTLATNKDLLAAVKVEIANNLKTAPLYNSELFTKNLERIYNKMWEQYQTGKKEIISLD